MKKGFLNRPGALSIDKGSTTKTAKSAEKTVPCNVAKVSIPSGAINPPDPSNPDPLSVYRRKDQAFNVVSIPRMKMTPDAEQSMCILLPDIKAKILAIPSFPGHLQTPFPKNYRISSVPGAGLGMFATRDLNRGDLILVERPLVVLPAVMPYSPGVVLDFDQLFGVALDAMPAQNRKNLFALKNCKNYASELQGIIDTNALSIGTLSGHDLEYVSVYCDISRINHSCSPNATHHWTLQTFAMSIRALRPILSGEQIFITYCPMTETRRDRRDSLLSRYSFKCECTSCRLPAAESAASDVRRESLQSLASNPGDDSSLKAWIRDFSLPDDYIIKECKTMWESMEAEEGCGYPEFVWPAIVQRLCKAYCALGDLDGAREWAKRGAELMKAFTGNDGGWMKVFDAPQNTVFWELRARARALAEK